MTRRTLKTLLAVVAVLIGLLAVVELSENGSEPALDRLLLPGLKAAFNDVDSVTVTRGGEPPVSIEAEGGEWVVAERGGYAADVGKVREVLLALADARVVEEKTSNPERYAQLGVDEPAAGRDSARIDITAGDRQFAVIVGNPSQRNFRYVRLPDAPASLMVDRNPQLPATAGDWLRPDVLDIAGERIRAVGIVHADGEEIRISKSEHGAGTFTVDNLPDGRELSYPAVANGIGGALTGLTLEDVRAAVAGEPAVTTRFETFDGLVVTASLVTDDAGTWIGLSAAADVMPAAATEPGNAAAEDVAERGTTADPAQEAADINARLGRWQFRVADHKANLLKRRWEDVLKTEG